MVRVVRQVTIFATVLALSGSQAVLAACLAVCLSGVPASAAPHHGLPPAEAAASSAAAPTAAPTAAHHEHHGSAHTPDVPEAAAPHAGDGSAPRLQARCGSCCPDTDVTVAAGPRAPRPDAVAFAVELATASWQRSDGIGRIRPSSGPPVSPPPPVGALTPLRI